MSVQGGKSGGPATGVSGAPRAGPGATGSPPHIRVEMLSCPRFLAGAREMVASLSRRLGFDEIAACQIALAVDEALANVIRHGYERREDQPIWMSIWQLDGAPPATPASQPTPAGSGEGLVIVIEDQGRQTEPEAIKGRDLEDIRPGGLGVHIIREVMDEVVYEKRNGGGMRLTLVKRLEPIKDAGSGNDPGSADGAGAGKAPGAPRGTTNG